MRVVPYDQVRSRRRDLRRLLLLPAVNFIRAFCSPVDVNDHEITVCFRRGYHFQKRSDLQTPEHPRSCLCRPFGIRWKCPLDLCCGDKGDLLSIGNKGDRFHRLIKVPSRSHIGHSNSFQRVQRIRKGDLPVIVGMVVRQRHKIRAHVKQPGRILRIRPEREFLSSRGCAARRVGEFVVHHKNIGTAHDG